MPTAEVNPTTKDILRDVREQLASYTPLIGYERIEWATGCSKPLEAQWWAAGTSEPSFKQAMRLVVLFDTFGRISEARGVEAAREWLRTADQELRKDDEEFGISPANAIRDDRFDDVERSVNRALAAS